MQTIVKALIGLGILACSVFSLPSFGQWFSEQQAIMGTRVYAEIWAEQPEQGQQALAAVMQIMRQVDADMSPYIESSELYKINALAASSTVTVCPELFALIQRANKVSELTQGAFDITFASAGFMYDYRHGQKPDAQALAQVTPAINYHLLQLAPAERTIHFADPRVKIDLGGIAKGYAVQRAIVQLRNMGIRHALVSAGGDTGLLGDRLGRPWLVGIQDPRQKQRQAVKLPLADEAISTSGDYERYFEADGQRFHHILNPKTGDSAREVQSVSIIGPDAEMTDALSTSVFVLGVQSGLALVNTLPDYEAVIIDNQRKMHYSAGLLAQ